MLHRPRPLPTLPLALCLALIPLACSGDDGDRGPAGPNVINASTISAEALGELDVVSAITRVSINSPPVVTFTLETSDGVPITGIVPFWEASNRYVRFTITKLVPGTNGDPDRWVAYVRDGGEPDYDTGSSLVDMGNGSYRFTFNTNVRQVMGVPFEGSLTHRVAGQIGSRSVPLEAQNLWMDFVPNGGQVSRERSVAVMDSCNECHDDLVFHGRRFETEYCVQCHNQDLAGGEGGLAFMIHRIHASGDFDVLEGGVSFSEVTYPQDLQNCRKCHNGDDPATGQADNWRNTPNIEACDGCHDVFDYPNLMNITHSGGALTTNSQCVMCHGPMGAVPVEAAHVIENATPNNPTLRANQSEIAYELVDVAVAMGGDVTIQFRVTADGTALDVANLPASLTDPMTMEAYRYPGFLLAWALPQDGIMEPSDFNNMGRRGAQPLSLSFGDFSPIEMGAPVGMLAYDAMTGINTATVTDAASQFPMGATLRTVAIQGYFSEDTDGDNMSDTSLHAPSVMLTATGDTPRRVVVDSNKCTNCHEWFEGHGGNRVIAPGSDVICVVCHNPNQSSSGRTVTDPTARGLDAALLAAINAGTLDPSVDPSDPLTYPEDAQNLKDLVHGIHSADDRDRPFQHVRGPGRQGYYDWEEVTFPRGASTSNCSLCHVDGAWELPLDDDALATTVRTTGVMNGIDPDNATVENAFVNVPNTNDWVNTKTSATCFACHTSTAALAHMTLNGGFVSDPRPNGDGFSNRSLLGTGIESCSVCHAPGKIADVEEVHDF